MKKYITYKIWGFILLVFAFASCDSAKQDAEPVVSPDGYPNVTFTAETPGSAFDEGDTVKYLIRIDKQLDRSLTFSARVVGGTASEDDFEIINAVIAPYTNEAELLVIISQDYAADPDETAELEVGLFSLADKYLVNKSTVNPTQSITITNFESDILEMAFVWSKTVLVDPGYPDFPDYRQEYPAASYVDFDFAIAEAAGYDPLDPWLTGLDYIAASSSSPETAEFEGVPDGEYIIFSELWYNAFADLAEFPAPFVVEHADIPVTAYFAQQGLIDEITLVQDPSQVLNSSVPGLDNNEYAGELVNTFVAGLIVDAGVYSILDYEGNVLKKGKFKDNLNLKITKNTVVKKK